MRKQLTKWANKGSNKLRAQTVATITVMIVAMTLPLAGATPPGAPVPNTLPHEKRYFNADPTGLINSIDQTGRARLLVGDHGMLEIELHPTDLFSTDSPMVEIEDGRGNVIETVPITARPYHGIVAGDDDSMAAITIDEPGVYGLIVFKGQQYDYSPEEKPQKGRVLTRVEWVEIPGADAQSRSAAEIVHDAHDHAGAAVPVRINGPSVPAKAAEDDNDVCWGPYQTDVTGDVKAYASARYVTARSDYATLITNGFNVQEWLWGCYSSVNMNLYSITAPGVNYSDSTDCGTLLNAFFTAVAEEAGIESKALFTGNDITWSCLGKGYSDGAGVMEGDPYTLVLAKEFYTGDTYNPYTQNHLGALIAQETAHNWGEPAHPVETHNGKMNVMMGGGSNDWNNIGFWFTTGSASNVYNAWH